MKEEEEDGEYVIPPLSGIALDLVAKAHGYVNWKLLPNEVREDI